MSAQLWHYLGYRGAFITYSWPSTPKNMAYLRDLDTASMSSRSFRIFLDFLAQQPEVEKIHILGYSAGTRLVTRPFIRKPSSFRILRKRRPGKKQNWGP